MFCFPCYLKIHNRLNKDKNSILLAKFIFTSKSFVIDRKYFQIDFESISKCDERY